jgi:hypothetical protein
MRGMFRVLVSGFVLTKVSELRVQPNRLLMLEGHLGIEWLAEEKGVRPSCGSLPPGLTELSF